ncbi:hypothetical protein RHGRI_028821 [Rhododendron griersonianum]|uniref:R13L1/DRL21-like LRR repeat region domain-containing protein n=1 Tax=Rhododendron griersonianum TaxID=479676 RepID=A0AAV6IMS5_9ERIC|nr:hypothetical protein RHGRI_028821 [Rhododendron griersonianum]
MLEVPSLRSFVLHPNTDFSWEEVSPWISKQKYLRVLDLGAGTTFVKVPRLISNSNHLRYLDMSSSDIVYIPESVCDLQNLETLKLKNCRKLQKLPKGMRYMINLIYLDIKGCDSLISTPPKLGQLTSLRRLSTFIVGQAEGYRIGELKELNLAGELEIKKLDNVRSPADAENANLKRKHDLVSLNLRWSDHKEENLPNDVEGVLESLQPHSNLKKLSIRYYRGSKLPNWMTCSVLKNLVELSLFSCSRCEQLPPLGKLHSLKKLVINGMDSLKCFDPECYGGEEISFQALETLILRGMPSLEEWTTMDRQDVFPRLRELDMNSCPKLTNFPALPALKILEIDDSEMLVKSVNNLTSLSSLRIENFQLEILPDGLFQNLEALESLQLSWMPNIETLQNQMSGLSSLKRLSVRCCSKLGNLQGLETLNSLDSLEICFCFSLTDLKGLEGLTSLRSLFIFGCPEMQSFPEGMRHLNSLQHRLLIVFGKGAAIARAENGLKKLVAYWDSVFADYHELAATAPPKCSKDVKFIYVDISKEEIELRKPCLGLVGDAAKVVEMINKEIKDDPFCLGKTHPWVEAIQKKANENVSKMEAQLAKDVVPFNFLTPMRIIRDAILAWVVLLR